MNFYLIKSVLVMAPYYTANLYNIYMIKPHNMIAYLLINYN